MSFPSGIKPFTLEPSITDCHHTQREREREREIFPVCPLRCAAAAAYALLFDPIKTPVRLYTDRLLYQIRYRRTVETRLVQLFHLTGF